MARLNEAFPHDDVLAEEGASGAIDAAIEERRWIIDPLDGTTNFTHGVPPYAVSIALQDGPQLVLGVVLDVAHDELFVASLGEGLRVNGTSAGVSDPATLDESLLATGFPFRDYRYLDAYLDVLGQVARSTRGIRRHGAAAVDLAWVACGRFDGFFEAGLAPWDTAAA